MFNKTLRNIKKSAYKLFTHIVDFVFDKWNKICIFIGIIYLCMYIFVFKDLSLIYWYLFTISIFWILKEVYYEISEIIPVKRLPDYPQGVMNHASFGIDGYVKIKRRILRDYHRQ